MAYPPQLLDQIRERVSLAGVIGRRVKLQKRGRDYIGLCPFHKEKTPSFNVVEEKGFFHCFGCGSHGDAIGFTMRMENLGFREAVEQLAKQAGVDLPEETPAVRAEVQRAATLHEACEAACEAFEKQLLSPAGADALAYLRGRGLTDELIRRFRLGWAPDSRNFLKEALQGRFPESLLIEAGLLRQGDHGTFDFFRGRVIFPIFDRSGRVVAFGGRTMGDGQPKYLNSPDTPIFHKGRTLYGLHEARRHATKEAQLIVVEGYMDVISLHSAGFRTAVAPLGTAITEEQLSALWRISDDPILCFDGDAAGYRAAARALERALPLVTSNKTLFFVHLEHGEDPDSLIKTQGAEGLYAALRSGKPLSEFLWATVTANKRPESAEQLASVIQRLNEKLATIADRNIQKAFRTILFDRLWEIFRRGRSSARDRDKFVAQHVSNVVDLSPKLTRNKIALLLIAAAVNHPFLLSFDIDVFVNLRPKTPEASSLQQDIVSAVSDDPEIKGEDLLKLLWAKHHKLLTAIFEGNPYRSTLTVHPHASEQEARLGWESLVNRLLVAELEGELQEAVRCLAEATTEENARLLELRREAYQYHNREERLMEQEREPVELRRAWRPPAGSADSADERQAMEGQSPVGAGA